jgi:hypothetical protein
MRRIQKMTPVLVATCALISVLLAPAAGAGPRAHAAALCQRRFRDPAEPVYDRLVKVLKRRHLTCSRAAAISSHVATLAEHGLPIADYPASPGPPVGRGRGEPFRVATALGEFTCHITATGSDFVTATCSRGNKFVKFKSLNHAYLH